LRAHGLSRLPGKAAYGARGPSDVGPCASRRSTAMPTRHRPGGVRIASTALRIQPDAGNVRAVLGAGISFCFVMAGLVPAIHALLSSKAWMPGPRPGMTVINHHGCATQPSTLLIVGTGARVLRLGPGFLRVGLGLLRGEFGLRFLLDDLHRKDCALVQQ